MTDYVYGMSVSTLIEVRRKLQVIGIELEDLDIFLEKDSTQLLAAQKVEIARLNHRIHAASVALKGES